MRFFLMQRDHQVAVIEIAEKTGDIIDVAEVLSAQRIPLGAKHINGSFDVLSLRKWWAGRGIPASRSGLEHALEALHVPYAELLLVKCSGLSLSDQYWVTPCDAPQRWHDVNFYENDFSDEGMTVRGRFLICGLNGDKVVGLSKDQADRYSRLLFLPQVETMQGGELPAAKIRPQDERYGNKLSFWERLER